MGDNKCVGEYRDTLPSVENCPGQGPLTMSEPLHGSPGLRRNRTASKCLASQMDHKMRWVRVKESTCKIRVKKDKFSEMELGMVLTQLFAVRWWTEMQFCCCLFLSQYSYVIITIIWLKADLTVTILELAIANKTLKSVFFSMEMILGQSWVELTSQ